MAEEEISHLLVGFFALSFQKNNEKPTNLLLGTPLQLVLTS